MMDLIAHIDVVEMINELSALNKFDPIHLTYVNLGLSVRDSSVIGAA